MFRRFFSIYKVNQYAIMSLKSSNLYHKIEKELNEIKEGTHAKDKIDLCGLEFPYYTLQDIEYQNFMTLIFRNLEDRSYQKDKVFINELEECNEVLFVHDGKYDVGFEVNR